MKFVRKKRGDKLYKQWAKHGYLPPEAIPQKESSESIPAGKEKSKQGLRLLYILFGLGIFIVCVGLILLIIQSC